ncbi:hypothetical protein AVEN_74071-1 [Araneus ventricosus]|uniref:Uncharacterized protein n=1 Tax=Araneus ventricosus TaxID=182803 RepID=A0A4Y2PH19_ARAVE|nr:hypothetical protein AVEN_74071-1 [Araneus ventricosus]
MKTFPIDGHRQLKDAGQISPDPPAWFFQKTVSGVGLEQEKKEESLGGSWKRKEFSKLMDGIRRGGVCGRRENSERWENRFIKMYFFLASKAPE